MAAALAAAEPEAIPRTAFDISAITGLAERLEPTRTTAEAIKTNKRKDGRGLDAWRAAHVTTNGDAATATIQGSRATARARIAAPEKDEPRLGFEVRRGALEFHSREPVFERARVQERARPRHDSRRFTPRPQLF